MDDVTFRGPRGRTVTLPAGDLQVPRFDAHALWHRVDPAATPGLTTAADDDVAQAFEGDLAAESAAAPDPGPVHVGGGWYEHPDGSRTRGPAGPTTTDTDPADVDTADDIEAHES